MLTLMAILILILTLSLMAISTLSLLHPAYPITMETTMRCRLGQKHSRHIHIDGYAETT